MSAKIFEGPVYLEPIEHKYIHRETGKKYTSVTTVLALIEPEFDTEGVAEAITHQRDDVKQERYIDMTKDQILDFWDELNATACDYGTHIHETIETYLLKNKWWFPEDPLEQAAIKGYVDLKVDEGTQVWPERIMFSSDYELAGTADLIIDIEGGFFDVGDWKTNKVFNFHSVYGNQTLLKPFEHLQNCHHSIYSLQLSVYAYMYELETGKRCRQIWIGYWDKEEETLSRIPIMYMKAEAKKMLDVHRYNLLKAA